MTHLLADPVAAFTLPGTDPQPHSLADYAEDQSVARVLGAERTPEVFVFGAGRRFVYHGAVGDNRDGRAVTAHSLRLALDAVLGAKAPLVGEMPAIGCSVKWRP